MLIGINSVTIWWTKSMKKLLKDLINVKNCECTCSYQILKMHSRLNKSPSFQTISLHTRHYRS